MSKKRSFSITLILKAYFSNHKALAKLFINEDMKTISDVEEKISTIFAIKNFYLLSNEYLLPSSEDIRIIENGDIITVVPDKSLDQAESQILLLDKNFYVKEKTEKEKKKKRTLSSDECPVKKKKHKKKLKPVETVPDEIISKKKKKCSKKKLPKKNVDNSEPKLIEFKSSTPFENQCSTTVFKFGGDENPLVKQKNNETKSIIKNEEYINSKVSIEKTSEKYSSSDNEIEVEEPKVQTKLNVKKIFTSSSDSNDKREKPTTSVNFSRNLSDLRVELDTSLNSTTDSDLVPIKTIKKVSWCTQPLQKTTNHVKIAKISLEHSELDYSKFNFNPSDAGTVPIPNPSKDVSLDPSDASSDEERNDISEQIPENLSCSNKDVSVNLKLNDSLKKNLDNMQKCIPAKSSSQSEVNNFIPTKNLTECCNDNLNNTELQEKSCISATDSNNYRNSNESEKVINTEEEKSICDIDKSESNSEKHLESNGISSKISNLSSNSIKIKKNRGNDKGVSYFLKLMDKLDWDVTKSIANVDIDDTNTSQPKIEVDNQSIVTETSDSIASQNFVTKRKRKRKHKKNIRVKTPIPMKRTEMILPRKIFVTPGSPKQHIRFENNDDEGQTIPDTDALPNESINENNSNNVRILQNVTLNNSNDSVEEEFDIRKQLREELMEYLSSKEPEKNSNLSKSLDLESAKASLLNFVNSFEQNSNEAQKNCTSVDGTSIVERK